MAEQRTYKAPRINLEDFAQQVSTLHSNEGYEVQVAESKSGTMTQSRAKDFIRKQSVALTVTATVQGENLVQASSQQWERNVREARHVLGQAKSSLAQDGWGRPGKVTWVSLPPNSEAVCPNCGHALRSGAEYCDQCGKPIPRF